MKNTGILFSVFVALVMSVPSISMAKTDATRRQEIDQVEKQTLSRLFKEASGAKSLLQQSYGYAVFKQSQTAFMISGGSGKGVAVNQKKGKRTYMKMASAGIGVGVGVQMMFTVVLFQGQDKFTEFVEKGWDGDTSASAAAAKEGINKGASFTNGVMVYQLTDKGLIAQASVKGSKYWKDKDLNKK